MRRGQQPQPLPPVRDVRCQSLSIRFPETCGFVWWLAGKSSDLLLLYLPPHSSARDTVSHNKNNKNNKNNNNNNNNNNIISEVHRHNSIDIPKTFSATNPTNCVDRGDHVVVVVQHQHYCFRSDIRITYCFNYFYLVCVYPRAAEEATNICFYHSRN